MNLSIWEPFAQVEELLNAYQHPKGYFTPKAHSKRSLWAEKGEWIPAVDLIKSDSGYQIKAELPGVNKEDISISVENDSLTIKGSKKSTTEEKNHSHRERFYGSFVRNFSLPTTIDKENISSGYKDGVLTVNIPNHEKEKAKKLTIGITE